MSIKRMDGIYRDASKKEVEMLEHLMQRKGVDGFWRDVEIFMTYIYQTYPYDMQALELETKIRREGAFNKFSSNKSKTQRHLVVIPDMLDAMLNAVYKRQYPVTPKQFRDGFFKRYPKLRLADVI